MVESACDRCHEKLKLVLETTTRTDPLYQYVNLVHILLLLNDENEQYISVDSTAMQLAVGRHKDRHRLCDYINQFVDGQMTVREVFGVDTPRERYDELMVAAKLRKPPTLWQILKPWLAQIVLGIILVLAFLMLAEAASERVMSKWNASAVTVEVVNGWVQENHAAFQADHARILQQAQESMEVLVASVDTTKARVDQIEGAALTTQTAVRALDERAGAAEKKVSALVSSTSLDIENLRTYLAEVEKEMKMNVSMLEKEMKKNVSMLEKEMKMNVSIMQNNVTRLMKIVQKSLDNSIEAESQAVSCTNRVTMLEKSVGVYRNSFEGFVVYSLFMCCVVTFVMKEVIPFFDGTKYVRVREAGIESVEKTNPNTYTVVKSVGYGLPWLLYVLNQILWMCVAGCLIYIFFAAADVTSGILFGFRRLLSYIFW